ncbi:MAG: carboxypeptidase-like regulatory domain-containing protein [Candidatus Hodarchaeota archaeon]
MSDQNQFHEVKTLLPALENTEENFQSESLIKLPSLAIQHIQFSNINILFIVGDENSPDPFLDQPFYNNITNLGMSVIYHDANNSYNYSDYDAIIISDSIDEVAIPGSVDSLENATIPILTMEPKTWNIFSLGNSYGVSIADNKLIDVLDNSSYITNHLPLGPLNISTDPNADKNYLTGFNAVPPESNVIGLIRPTYNFPSEKFYRSLVVLDKEGVDWSGIQRAPDRRAFFGFSTGPSLNLEGWKLWNKTLKWILYDDYLGNASITVNVIDRNYESIFNATVTLKNSSTNIIQYTNDTGSTVFNNISWGQYNITVDFEGNTDNNLTFIEIVPNRTYHQTAQFTFNVQLPFYLDIIPPWFFNIHFDKDLSQGTFYAEVKDENLVESSVTLNITAINLTSGLIVVEENFTMVQQIGNTFYNDTALDTIIDISNISIKYNIIAEDTAGNINKTQLITFFLSDPDPPIIQEVNVTDYGDGTLDFYAIITDESGIQDVLLQLNGTFHYMNLNESGYWIHRTQAYFGVVLNYTIFSVNDTVGNENGSKIPSFPMTPGYITVSDTTPPQLEWRNVTNDKGLVEWQIRLYESTIFQSGLDINSVNITISVNYGVNLTYPMINLGGDYFYFFGTYTYNDIVEFWINASDLAENSRVDYGIIEINDSAIPEVAYNAIDLGNGTVIFYVTVVDWPNNITTAFVYENSTGIWVKYNMTQINDNLHTRICRDFTYSNRDLFYYAEAIDEAGNNNSITQIKQLILTDLVPPEIDFTVENSLEIDGQIRIQALAIDSWGSSQYVINPFYVNITEQDLTTTYEMEQEVVYYVSTHNFHVSDQLTITIWTYDDAGNQGLTTKLVIIDDLAPPKIMNPDAIIYQNGTVLIWAEVVDYGSGLANDNSSVTINYNDPSSYRYNSTMIWNGTGNFYTFLTSGYGPEQTLIYIIYATDKNNNPSKTDPIFVPIIDLTPPVFNNFSYSQKLVDHTTTKLSFWANVSDPFGNIEGVNLTLNYLDKSQWFNRTYKMNYNGSHYISSFELICDHYFCFSLKVYDEASNALNSPLLENWTLDFFPTTAQGYGVEFRSTVQFTGKARFWIKINDIFEEHTFQDHTLILSVIDETLGTQIINQEAMNSNDTHHIFDLSIEYMHIFSYTIQVIDDGVIGGFYDPYQYTNSSQMLDYWRPIITKSEITEINDTAFLVWANISDWGSGVKNVTLYYKFSPFENNGGSGSQFESKKMEFNGSYGIQWEIYTIELNSIESAELLWYIVVFDDNLSSTSEERTYNHIIPPEPFLGFNLTQTVIIILIVIVVLISTVITLFSAVRMYQKKSSARYQKVKEFEEKLSLVSNVYAILLSTDVGVPVYTVTNVVYQRDKSLSDALSGLSVGIDSFLQSFQSDFLNHVQQQESEYYVETRLDEKIRISVIEQQKFQILIVASESFRLFVFLREKPPAFARDAFYQAIKEIEKWIHIPNLGIVDESMYKTQIQNIISKYFPLPLLLPFTIDLVKLKTIEIEEKHGLRPVQISQVGINALKRLTVVTTFSKTKTIDAYAEIQLFDREMHKGTMKKTKRLLYNDAKKVMTELLKIPPEDIYEALWKGSSAEVGLIESHEE